jgi:hypothetical protein
MLPSIHPNTPKYTTYIQMQMEGRSVICVHDTDGILHVLHAWALIYFVTSLEI